MAIELKTTDVAGKPAGSLQLDEAALGGRLKPRLLHAAGVMYHNNLRQGTHSVLNRKLTAGSNRKLYKQKGTGNARAGSRRSGTRKGGGRIHGPMPRDYVWHMPVAARRAALRNAVLGKAKDGELHVLEALAFEAPKTKNMVALLAAHGLAGKKVLVATEGLKRAVQLAGRNLEGVTVLPATEINARDVLSHQHLVIERASLEALAARARRSRPARKAKGTRKGADAEGTLTQESGS